MPRSWRALIFAYIPHSVFALFVGVLMAIVGWGTAEKLISQKMNAQQQIKPAFRKIPIDKPVPSQEAIEEAIRLFEIEIAPNITHPYFDPALDDRGLTTGNPTSNMREVSIGPAAFTSWAILGSTLAHEAEIHGNQSFYKIVALNKMNELQAVAAGFLSFTLSPAVASEHDAHEQHAHETQKIPYGTLLAEREAYLFEIENAGRFGLTKEEVAAIQHILDTYFPEPEGLAAKSISVND